MVKVRSREEGRESIRERGTVCLRCTRTGVGVEGISEERSRARVTTLGTSHLLQVQPLLS